MTSQTIKVQIDDLVREATSEEIALMEAQSAEQAIYDAAKEAKAVARLSALAKLAAIGLTQEEIDSL